MHAVHCEILGHDVDSRVERAFARGLDEAGLLDVAEYHPDAVDTAEGRWEPDFRVNGWLVECKNGDVGGAMGSEPYSQATKIGLVNDPVLLYGLPQDAEAIPHNCFLEYRNKSNNLSDELIEIV